MKTMMENRHTGKRKQTDHTMDTWLILTWKGKGKTDHTMDTWLKGRPHNGYLADFNLAFYNQEREERRQTLADFNLAKQEEGRERKPWLILT